MAHKMVTYLRNCHRYSYYDGYGRNDVDSASTNHAKLSNLCSNSHIMDHNNNNRVPRIHAFSSPAPPSPPMLSFIVALSLTTLTFMCLYVFSSIVSVAILLALCITILLAGLCMIGEN
ncbi:hypothetical protein JHK82_016375 [Glycine max]|nr:hypothetical protein JHK85_016788 [Glycine max]KAG5149494.1 hypothetical protein JHK82_016375 [Glycine max]